MRASLALVVAMIFAALVVLVPQSSAVASHQQSANLADQWAIAVADFVSDPHFNRRVPDSLLGKRFLPLLSSPRLDRADPDAPTASGENPKMGITTIRANFAASASRKGSYSLASIHLAVESVDSHGTKVLPLLKAKLKTRLSKPTWSGIADGDILFWRKGTTHQFVSLNPTAGSTFTLDAGEEEGDSEGDPPDHAKPCI